MSSALPSTLTDSTDGDSRPSHDRLALALIVVVAAVLRFGQLNAQSLSMDEVNDLQHATAGWRAIFDYKDRFPPLYYLLEHWWLRAVPWDHSGHALSAVFGVLTVVATAHLVHALGKPNAALWAAGLVAISPIALRYSLESRAYGLYMLLAVVALGQFMAALGDNDWRHWAGFIGASVVGAYVHYYMGILIALAGVYFLATRPQRATLKRGLAAFALIAVASAPVLWLMARDLDRPWGYARTSEFSPAALAYTYYSYLSGYVLGPSLRQLHTISNGEALRLAAPWLAVVGIATATLVMLAIVSEGRSRGLKLALWYAVFGLAPALIVGLLARGLGLGYNIRHMVWASVPLSAVLAIGASQDRPRWLARASMAVLAAAFLVGDYNRLAVDEHRNEDVRSAARHIAAAGGGEPVYVLSGYMSRAFSHYLPPGWQVEPLPDPAADDGDADLTIDSVRQHSRVATGFWFAYVREFHGDPQALALAALESEFDLQLDATFAGIRLYHGRARVIAPAPDDEAP